MQQIAMLILMCLIINVHSIRNIATSSSGSSSGNQIVSGGGGLTQRRSTTNYYTIEHEAAAADEATTTNYLPPTELIGFTLADATPHTSAYNQQQQQQQQHPSYSNDFGYNQRQQQQQRPSLVPAQLQTSPILSYRDPYTNEQHHHQYTPQQQQHTFSHRQQQQQYPHQHYADALLTVEDVQQPQEYTVQSSLLVDANQPYDFAYHKRRTTAPGGGGGGGGEYQRPGLVFEEPLGVSTATTAAAAAHNYATRPLGPFTRPTRPPHPPPPPPPPSSSYTSPSSSSSSSASFGYGGSGVKERPYLSYDSHDYPPPSYYQQQQQQQQQQLEQQKPQQQQLQLHFQSPQRQDTTVPNYANNFGNYLPNSQPQQQHQQQHETFYQPYRQPQPQQSPRPTFAYNNYYDYQLGELPPSRPPPSQQHPARPIYNNGAYRPPSPSISSPPQRAPTQVTQAAAAESPFAGLANLATFITGSTQSYAPQFTNLILGTLGVGGGGSNSIASNLVGGTRPLNMQLIKALENIARNDELQCVPKVLCQMIARQTERGQLPNFVTSPAITNFLAGFPTASPALIYGRAALLGISGGETSCTRSYAKCPKNEYEILYYLNNHRGGFFKFFSEPEEKEQPQQHQHQSATQNDESVGGGGASIFSLLSALTGVGGGGDGSVAPTSPPRPKPTPTESSGLDITSGIGNFFSQVLSDYLGGGVEYQRRRRRDLSDKEKIAESKADDRKGNDEEEAEEKDAPIKAATENIVTQLPADFHDVEDEEDTQNNETLSANGQTKLLPLLPAAEEFGDVEGRILHKDVLAALELPKFFPDDEKQQEHLLRTLITQFNASKSSRKLKFPTAVAEVKDEQPLTTEMNEDEQTKGGHVLFEGETVQKDNDNITPTLPSLTLSAPQQQRKYRRRGKKLIFKETETNFADSQTAASQQSTALLQQQQLLTPNGGRVIFPDGTRNGRILNRPNQLSTQITSEDDSDKFVISNAHRSVGARGENAAYYSSHRVDSHYSSTNSIANRYSSTYSANSNNHNSNNKAYQMYNDNSRPSAATSGGNMRYSSRYQTMAVTRRPTPPPYEDNKNIYVTNGQGVTEYFITPEGRKVYL